MFLLFWIYIVLTLLLFALIFVLLTRDSMIVCVGVVGNSQKQEKMETLGLSAQYVKGVYLTGREDQA